VHSCSIRIDDGILDESWLKQALAFPKIEELWFTWFDKIDRSGVFKVKVGRRSRQLEDGRPAERDYECGFLDSYDLSGIQTIRLRGDFTTTEVIRFMLAPSVRILHCEGLNIMNQPGLVTEVSHKVLALTNLNLLGGGRWRIEPDTLHQILIHCPSLRMLRCQVPMDARVDNFDFDRASSRVLRPVSPKNFTAALDPVRQTLQKLSLLNGRHSVPYDGSCLNLSRFGALTDLEITSCCLMPPGPPCQERDRLHRLLPSNLQHLKVCCDEWIAPYTLTYQM
jgi:hypothetical protein